MSQNNDNSAMVGVAIVMAVVGMAALFLFALFSFVAILVTGLALAAWNKPLQLGSKTLIYPHEARAFVIRGLIGAALAPAFALFCEGLFEVRINPDYWLHIIIGGYALGSLGYETYFADQNQSEVPIIIPEPERQLPAPPQQPVEPDRSPEPFRFASWNDEEELK